jgi:uroporphyrinogen decarboxylase
MTNGTRRRRLEAAIAGEKLDRLPVALWRHWPGDDQDAAALAAAHLKWQADYDWDLLKVSPASSYSVIDWGVEDRWVGHIEGTRENTRLPIHAAAEWEALRPLDPSRGMLATQIETLRRVGEGLRGEVPFLATVFSPLSVAKHLATNPVMISHLRREPDAFRRGLETITESVLRFIDAARATGISGIYYAIQHAAYPLLSEEEYRTFGRPYDERILSACGDLWATIVHLHGTDVMFDAVASLGAPILNWHDRDAGISLADGLGRMRGAASGGVGQWTLHRESPERALEEAADAAEQVGGRRLLLGTGCVIMATTPLRNIRALREAAESLPVR